MFAIVSALLRYLAARDDHRPPRVWR